jgi:hypothetical protein
MPEREPRTTARRRIDVVRARAIDMLVGIAIGVMVSISITTTLIGSRLSRVEEQIIGLRREVDRLTPTPSRPTKQTPQPTRANVTKHYLSPPGDCCCPGGRRRRRNEKRRTRKRAPFPGTDTGTGQASSSSPVRFS